MPEATTDRVGPRVRTDLVPALEQYRSELTGYAYRMLGSAFEADDAVQETMLRAWKALDRLEGPEALRAWLYRIATNVSLDMLKGRQRRARPMELRAPQSASTPLPAPLPEATWLGPIADELVIPGGEDPAEVAEMRESVRLAFVAALQRLPPRQRAVLILREVLHWHADEVAELLGTSVASVNSALQRARASVARSREEGTPPAEIDDEQRGLLARYVEAFERYDMSALTALLREDATWNMPPYDLWLQTHEDIVGWCLGTGIGCRDSRLVPVRANGSPAYAQYKPSADGGHEAWALQVLEVSGDRIAGVTFFLDVERIFPAFGLPLRLET
jgi:RNA polymerase sigma-70 factor (ECF subfamily)